jgi:type IV pilus assembly protein PilM
MTMAKGTTTLYISDSSIRLMVTRGKRIIKLADVPLEAGTGGVDSGKLENDLAARIKELFQRNHIGSRKVILGISGLHCLTRPLTLPDLPRTMLDEAVTREARRVLPVPPEQLHITWQSLSASENKIQAFMVAIPRYIADSVLKALGQAGFKPSLMDIKPLALARLARVPTAIIIDVQPGEFDIIVMVDGIPQPIRTLPFPEGSISFEERMGIVQDELQRTLQFYNSNNPERIIQPGTPMFVSGELADEPAIYESLGQAMGLQAAPLASPLKCLKQLDPSHHLVNVGLALKELTREAGPLLPNFNTLPTAYQPKQISLNRIMAVPMTAAAGALIILLAMTIQNASADLDTARVQLDSTNLILEKRQSERQELSKNIAALQARLDTIETSRRGFSAILESLTYNGSLMNSDINATVDSMVTDLDLGNIGHTGEVVSLKGQAASEEEVMDYVRKLTSTGRFSEITIANITRIEAASDNGTDMMGYLLALQLKEPLQ